MTTDTTGAKWVRGLVKAIFVLCYIAFMWASIHHIATYFNDFEANGDTIGSYALAGAFDITALVVTIGVMFFRKSMPVWVLVIVWGFILAIAGYSFFVNWEYASHYQNMSLIMQPTGATIPVFDFHGVLHYVPEMRANTALIWINPILASGFTIFSLIYSVIAEFFGTKLPTASELVERKKYLEETSELLDEIKQLEQKSKKSSLIQRTKAAVMEAKDAVNEVMAGTNDLPENDRQMEDDQGDTDIVPSPVTEVVPDAVPLPKLGFIEQTMYDQLTGHPELLSELAQVAQSTDSNGLTAYLQNRFASYAGYITHVRVTNVLEAIKRAGFFPPVMTISGNLHSGSERNPDIEETAEVEGEDFTEDQNSVSKTTVEQENEPSTNPEMEATNVTIFPDRQRTRDAKTTIVLNTMDITTRRKPLTLSEAAQTLGVSEKTVREWKRSGKLTTSADGRLFTASSVRKQLENRVKAL